MTKRKTIGDELEEVDKLFRGEDYENAVEILIRLLKKRKEATPYQIGKIGDEVNFATGKIALKKVDEGWHSNTTKSQGEKR